MLPDGSLERFDMAFTNVFRFPGSDASDVEREWGADSFDMPGAKRQKRLRGNVDIPQAMNLINEAMADFQGYAVPVRGNEMRYRLPYATYLEKGDILDNIDTRAEWIVKEVFRNEDGDATGEVIFYTDLSVPKGEWDRLRPRERGRIRFAKAWPKSLNSTYVFNNEGNLKQEDGPWTDTITWQIVRRQPGGVAKDPFSSPREVKPKFREFQFFADDSCDYVQATNGQVFDTIVQFDIWAKTNIRASILVEWFHDFMDLYRWVFMLNGVKQIWYWRQTADALVTRWRNDIVSQSVQFFFQTERLAHHAIRRIRDIEVCVEALTHVGETLQPQSSGINPTGCVDPTGQISVALTDGPGMIPL